MLGLEIIIVLQRLNACLTNKVKESKRSLLNRKENVTKMQNRGKQTGRFSRQLISQSIMQLILQTLVPNESSCSLDSENVPGFKI